MVNVSTLPGLAGPRRYFFFLLRRPNAAGMTFEPPPGNCGTLAGLPKPGKPPSPPAPPKPAGPPADWACWSISASSSLDCGAAGAAAGAGSAGAAAPLPAPEPEPPAGPRADLRGSPLRRLPF